MTAGGCCCAGDGDVSARRGRDGGLALAFAPLAIGLALTLIHLISIPIDNMSVNTACSIGPAPFLVGWPLSQLCLFWLAPPGWWAGTEWLRPARRISRRGQSATTRSR